MWCRSPQFETAHGANTRWSRQGSPSENSFKLNRLSLQVSVGETARTPVLLGHNIAGLRLGSASDLPPHVPCAKVFPIHTSFCVGHDPLVLQGVETLLFAIT